MNKLLVNRPWGNFLQYTHNESTTVKILTILPQQELSLQYHNHRKEFWRVLKGNPKITIGENVVDAKPNDEFEVQEKTQHRISAGTEEVQILEIAFGNFDENDIVRTNDKYGRV